MDKLLAKFCCIEGLIGNTPLIKVAMEYKGKAIDVFAKLEWFNFTGSIKDRAALFMIKDAVASGRLTAKHTIVEVSSGNMGISLAAIGACLGLKVIILMPNHVSSERKKIIEMLGATVVEKTSFDECFEVCKEEYSDSKKYFKTSQFDNRFNVIANHKTAEEILNKLPHVQMFVSGVGTGGTLTGVAEGLQKGSHDEPIIIAVDPKEAKLLTLGSSIGKHAIQGLSDGRIPQLYNPDLVNEIIMVSDNDAIQMARLLNGAGLPVGISGGANMHVALVAAEKYNLQQVVTIFPDDNKKYLSTVLADVSGKPHSGKYKVLGWSNV